MLTWLHKNWITSFKATLDQPLDAIRDYFGEAVALYFSFLQFYTRALLLPAATGFLLFVYQRVVSRRLDDAPTLAFAVGSAVWATLALKLWQRRQASLAYGWGTLRSAQGGGVSGSVERVRPEHTGPLVLNPATGELERSEGVGAQLARFALVTIPALALCVGAVATYIVICERLSHITASILAAPLAPLMAASPGLQQPWLASSIPGLQTGFSLSFVDASDGLSAPELAVSVVDEHLVSTCLAALQSAAAPGAAAALSAAAAQSRGSAATVSHALPGLLASALSLVPTILFLVGVTLFDIGNGRVAAWLTRFENHAVASEQRTAHLGKAALLALAGNLTPLAFVAFVRRDLVLLRERLVYLLVWKAALNNVEEVALPWVRAARVRLTAARGAAQQQQPAQPQPPVVAALPAVAVRSRRRSGALMTPASASTSSGTSKGGSASVIAVTEEAATVPTAISERAATESLAEAYDCDADVQEMLVQFAHVTLFAAVFPLAPAFALVNNVMEVHSDALKLLALQRPRPRRAAALGAAWSAAFECLQYLAVVTNVALVYVAGTAGARAHVGAEVLVAAEAASGARHQQHHPAEDGSSRLLWCLLLEHVLIVLKLLVEHRLPDVPHEVQMRVAADARAARLARRYKQDDYS